MLRRRGRGLVVSAIAAILAATMLPSATGVAYAADAVAAFDWRMPSRTGLDGDHDGVIDVMTTRSEIDPESWPVHFDACASTPSTGATILLYRWYVDRVLIGSPDAQTSPCGGFTYDFPAEGRYEITLAVRDSAGNEAHLVRDILVQDFLIVAIGDSLGSGQGNPDIPIPGHLAGAAEDALRELGDALDRLASIRVDYEQTGDRIQQARSRLSQVNAAVGHLFDVCDPFSPDFGVDACAAATEAVADAVGLLVASLEALGATFYQQTVSLLAQLSAAVATLARTAFDESRQLLSLALDELQRAWDALLAEAEAAAGDARTVYEQAMTALAPVWQDQRCNRSATSGQAQAAAALERSDPHTSVTLVHLACSGATIHEGLIGPYAGIEVPPGAPDLRPQVDRAGQLVGDREVDAVLVSIGVNDVGFGPMIFACILGEPCSEPSAPAQAGIGAQIGVVCAATSVFGPGCATGFDDLIAEYVDTRSAATMFAQGAALLPSGYAELAGRLAAEFPSVAAEPGRVIISEYPNTLEDDDGTLCDAGDDGLLDMLPGFTATESGWLRDTVTRSLNGMVAQAATDHGWTVVDGIFDAFARHGYCADDGWIRRLQESFAMQGTKEGTAHPTPDGHAIYGAGYGAKLMDQLFTPDGGGLPDLTRPRPPVRAYEPGHDGVAPTVIGVPDRAANAAGWYAADVVIDWQATDPAPSSGAPSDPPSTTASTEGAAVLYTSGPSCDPAGNCAPGSLALSIDRTPPTLTCPSPTPSFLLGAAGASVAATVSDGLSGPASVAVSAPADTASVGEKSVELTGRDLAGNETTRSCAYRVTFAFGGFLSPVDEGGVLNTVKAGRAIPLKWRVTDATGAPVVTLGSASVTVTNLECTLATTTDLVEETLAGGSGLQNLGDGYYQLNWKTPTSYAGSCKTMRLDLGEGIVHAALFKFTK